MTMHSRRSMSSRIAKISLLRRVFQQNQPECDVCCCVSTATYTTYIWKVALHSASALNWLRPVLHMLGPRQDGQISSDLRVKPPWCWQDLTGFLGLFIAIGSAEYVAHLSRTNPHHSIVICWGAHRDHQISVDSAGLCLYYLGSPTARASSQATRRSGKSPPSLWGCDTASPALFPPIPSSAERSPTIFANLRQNHDYERKGQKSRIGGTSKRFRRQGASHRESYEHFRVGPFCHCRDGQLQWRELDRRGDQVGPETEPRGLGTDRC
ncbi:hypothetical protein OKW47_004835 [Paraburkholderia atlantica]